MFVTVIVIAMRFIARIFVSHTTGMDDWCALAATILAIGMVISMNFG